MKSLFQSSWSPTPSLAPAQDYRRRLAAALWFSPVVATALLGMEAVKAAESWSQRPVSLESGLISQAVQPVGSPYNKAMRLGYAASERGDYTAATSHFREALL